LFSAANETTAPTTFDLPKELVTRSRSDKQNLNAAANRRKHLLQIITTCIAQVSHGFAALEQVPGPPACFGGPVSGWETKYMFAGIPVVGDEFLPRRDERRCRISRLENSPVEAD